MGNKRKIAVAVSGGIDSLAAAFLLKKEFDEVFGIHFITGFEKEKIDIDSISKQLDIEIKILDVKKDFNKFVINYFTDSYKNGKTPNPCLVCNRYIKFGKVLDFALKSGAEKLATGHYAIIKDNALFKGKDDKKEQSYFLAFLKPSQIAHACFPLGNLTKKEVKKIANANDLIAPAIKESSDICFIENETYGEFLEKRENLESVKGSIENIRGDIIGTHNGVHNFTIGQRKGIGCPAEKPYYVIKKKADENKIIVGFKEELLSEKCYVSDINWLEKPYDKTLKVNIRLRYRNKAFSGTLIRNENNKSEIIFDAPQYAVSPGQGAVFYKGDKVIGGGFID